MTSIAHAIDGGSADSEGRARSKTLPGTDRLRSEKRRDGRDRAAALFSRVRREQGWSWEEAARRLGVDASILQDMAAGTRPLCLGDVMQMGTLGIAVLRAALEQLEHDIPQAVQDAERLGLKVGQAAGELQASILRATEDGEVDESERLSICGHASELDALVHQTRRVVGEGR